MPGRKGAAIRTKKYERFRGVDFSADPALVDDARSPWAPNMIADVGGMPEKRPGWRTLESFDDPVNGLFSGAFDGETHLLAHVGDTLYRWYGDGETEPETLAEDLPDARSTAVWMGGRLWIFTGGGLYRYDGTNCENVSGVAYAPLTVIARTPLGGGVSYEPVNLLTGRQRVGFLADGTRYYYLPYAGVDSVEEVSVDGEIWQRDESAHAQQHTYSVNLATGRMVFTPAPTAPAAGAEDNVFVSFTKTVDGYADRIHKCRAAIVWGYGAARDRIVATGNPDFPNRDFICAFADGTYWPDTGYAAIGTEETAILGYCRLGEHLAVVKEDNGQDSTVFLRTSVLNEDGEAGFFVKPCLAGAGAVTRFGFGSVGDEQLILTRRGVYALTTNSLTAERIAENRSFRVDPRLTAEELAEAVCCSWNGAFLVFVGGRVYGLDGRQPRSYSGRNDTDFLYECFYWENVPARCVLVCAGDGAETLYFGTADGRVCRFSTDVAGMERFSDDGAAIEAVWTTRADDDGDPMVYKSLLRRGNAVTIKPHTRSSVKILFRTERDATPWQAGGTTDIFNWEDVDFGRFTFNANDGPAEIPFGHRLRRYRRLQIAVKNDAVNEGFGVYAIVKHFAVGGVMRK